MPKLDRSRNRSLSSLHRSGATRELKDKVYIVCEGQTEQWYFNYLKKLSHCNSEVVIEVRGGAPIGVVDRACEIKEKIDKNIKRLQKGDEIPESDWPKDVVWTVFDTERFSDNTSFHNAFTKAKDNNIQRAITNPCFEYWLLLHFEHPDDIFDGCKKAESKLKKYISEYQKGKDASKYFTLDKTKVAVERAKTICRSIPEDDKYHSTSSDLYKLVEVLFKSEK